MSGIYLVDLADVLRDAGIVVHEIDGWKTRARSSGGFPYMPLAVVWHHTASQTTPENDTAYMFFNAPFKPIGNGLLARDGAFWIGAAGGSNTAGRGGPLTVSRGVIPLDGANSRTFNVEAANNGVGELWPVAQIDAYFLLNNTLNEYFGNKPDDLFTHAEWAPTRKIDPARAEAVEGRWGPTSINSASTWRNADVQAEARKRATAPLPPTPEPPEEEDMATKTFIGRSRSGQDDGHILISIGGVVVHKVKKSAESSLEARMKYKLTDFWDIRRNVPVTEWSKIPDLEGSWVNQMGTVLRD